MTFRSLLAALVVLAASGAHVVAEQPVDRKYARPAEMFVANSRSGFVDFLHFEVPVWVLDRNGVNVAGFIPGKVAEHLLPLPAGDYYLRAEDHDIAEFFLHPGQTLKVDALDYLATLDVRGARQPIWLRGPAGTASKLSRLPLAHSIIQVPSGRYELIIGTHPLYGAIHTVDLKLGQLRRIDVGEYFGLLDVRPGNQDVRWRLVNEGGKEMHCCTLAPGSYRLVVDGMTLSELQVRGGQVYPIHLDDLMARVVLQGFTEEHARKVSRLVLRKQAAGSTDGLLYIDLGKPGPVAIPPGRYDVIYERLPGRAFEPAALGDYWSPAGEIDAVAGASVVYDVSPWLARVRFASVASGGHLHLSSSGSSPSGFGVRIHSQEETDYWLMPGAYTLGEDGIDIEQLLLSPGQTLEIDMNQHYGELVLMDGPAQLQWWHEATQEWRGHRPVGCDGCVPIRLVPGRYRLKRNADQKLREFHIVARQTTRIALGETRITVTPHSIRD